MSSLDPYSSSTRKRGKTKEVDENGNKIIYLSSPRLYVNNLAWNVTWQDLKGLFRQEGEVVRADVLSYADSGRSKGCGIVEFSDINAAARALTALNGVEFHGRPLFVREDRESTLGNRDQGGGSGNGAGRQVASSSASDKKKEDVIYLSTPRLYINNLAWDVSWQDLKDLFRQEGNVVRAEIIKDRRDPSRSKGCGLVEYSDINDAARALTSLNGVELRGRPIYVREDRETNEPSNGRSGGGRQGGGGRDTVVLDSPRVFVNNLPYDTAWQDLKDLFRKEGEVRRANIMTGPDGRSLGCGIVEFEDIEGAARAVRSLHNVDFRGRPLQVREDRENKQTFN